MSYPVTYYCPHCGTLVALERTGYLEDKSVTPYPLSGWTYVTPDAPFEAEPDVDGVRFVCGKSDGVEWDPHDGVRGPGVDTDGTTTQDDTTAVGCSEPFYLSFVRFESGREIDPQADTEMVEINPDPRQHAPSGPDGPSGPGGFW